MQSLHPGNVLLNGTNLDDLSDYRPGLQAATDFDVRSPLAECKLTKADVRIMARHLELPNWDKPASPCLSSRIPYGETVTVSKLGQIEEAEDYLNRLGFDEVRVRHYGNEARIEVPAVEIERLRCSLSLIQSEFHKLGFEYCHVDSEGLVSGKLNRLLQIGEDSGYPATD